MDELNELASHTLQQVKMRRILVAGELNADLILSGLPSLPILGRELIGTGFTMALGSSSAITAARLAALGAEEPDFAVDFVGVAGRDDIGRFVLAQLKHFGVHTDAVEIIDSPTGVTIALTYAQDRALLTYPGTIAMFDGSKITTAMLAKYTHLHVGSFFLQTGLQPQLASIFQQAHRQGLTTSLDTGWDPMEVWMNNPWLAGVLAETDVFFPNENESAALAPDIPTLMRSLAGTLIVKRGKHGASAYMQDGSHIDIPSFQVEAIDTTGAGDAFNAGYLFARFCCGEDNSSAVEFAVGCGAQATLHVGGATGAPTNTGIRQWMAHQKQT